MEFKLEQPQPKPQSDGWALAQQQPASSSGQADNAFTAAARFAGPRQGCVFTTGPRGTGYYRDTALQQQRPADSAEAGDSGAAAAPSTKPKGKPVMLKSSSIVKGLQRRAMPEKRKADSDGAEAGAAAGKAAKPRYLQEMERYKEMSCASDTKHDRPLVK